MVGVALDGSVWYLSLPGFCLATFCVGYLGRNLGSRFALSICFVLLAAWLVGCGLWFLRGESALADGLLVIGAFIVAVNVLRFSRPTIRECGLKVLPYVGFGIGFIGVLAFWLTSSEIARWFPSSVDRMLFATVPSLIAGSVGLLLGFIAKALRLASPISRDKPFS